MQGLVLFHVAFQTGFCPMFLRNFIKQLPFELIEAARIEGSPLSAKPYPFGIDQLTFPPSRAQGCTRTQLKGPNAFSPPATLTDGSTVSLSHSSGAVLPCTTRRWKLLNS